MSKHIGVHFSWQALNFDHRFLQKPYRKKNDTSPSPFSPFTLPVPLRNVPAQAKVKKIATKIRVRAGVEYFYGKRVMHLVKLRGTDYSRNRPVWTAV